MLILKFSLFLFLAGLTWISVGRALPPAPVGGPLYFAEAPDPRAALQPRWRLNAWQAFHSRRYVEAYFDDRCLPLLARHMANGREQWRMAWLWGRDGRLRRRQKLAPDGRLLSAEDFEAVRP